MTTTEYIVSELGRFLGLLPGWTFWLGCYLLWRGTYRISNGHLLAGQFCVLVLFIYNILMALKPEFVPTARPYVNASMTVWVFWNVLHFHRHPIPAQFLRADRSAEPNDAKNWYPRTKVGIFLTAHTTTRPFWFTTAFQWTTAVLVFMLFCAYFIQRLAVLAVDSDKRVVETTKNVANATAKVVEKKVEDAVNKAVAPLGERQIVILETAKKAVVTAEKANADVTGRFQSLSKQADRADRRAVRAERSEERYRNNPALYPLRTTPVRIEPISPSRVKSLPPIQNRKPTPQRGGKTRSVGYFEETEIPIDTTIYARNLDYPQP